MSIIRHSIYIYTKEPCDNVHTIIYISICCVVLVESTEEYGILSNDKLIILNHISKIKETKI